MNYPLISEYIEAIKSAEDNFEELSYLRPVLGDDGLPVMTSGNFAVVFKMKDEQHNKFYAVKCFTKEQHGRIEAYRDIAKTLEKIKSSYIVPITFYEKELFVDTDQSEENEFPVLLMDWVEGTPLDKFIRENYDRMMQSGKGQWEYKSGKCVFESLAYNFEQLSTWLKLQPFAHGDLKPDNILVQKNESLVLVDYDGMYVPTMKGQKARELGSLDFRHPLRTDKYFDDSIDNFSLASILLSLEAISYDIEYYTTFGASDRLLFSEKDYRNINNCKLISELLVLDNKDIKQFTYQFIEELLIVSDFLPFTDFGMKNTYGYKKEGKFYVCDENFNDISSNLDLTKEITIYQGETEYCLNLKEGGKNKTLLLNQHRIISIKVSEDTIFAIPRLFIPFKYRKVDILVKGDIVEQLVGDNYTSQDYLILNGKKYNQIKYLLTLDNYHLLGKYDTNGDILEYYLIGTDEKVCFYTKEKDTLILSASQYGGFDLIGQNKEEIWYFNCFQGLKKYKRDKEIDLAKAHVQKANKLIITNHPLHPEWPLWMYESELFEKKQTNWIIAIYGHSRAKSPKSESYEGLSTEYDLKQVVLSGTLFCGYQFGLLKYKTDYNKKPYSLYNSNGDFFGISEQGNIFETRLSIVRKYDYETDKRAGLFVLSQNKQIVPNNFNDIDYRIGENNTVSIVMIRHNEKRLYGVFLNDNIIMPIQEYREIKFNGWTNQLIVVRKNEDEDIKELYKWDGTFITNYKYTVAPLRYYDSWQQECYSNRIFKVYDKDFDREHKNEEEAFRLCINYEMVAELYFKSIGWCQTFEDWEHDVHDILQCVSSNGKKGLFHVGLNKWVVPVEFDSIAFDRSFGLPIIILDGKILLNYNYKEVFRGENLKIVNFSWIHVIKDSVLNRYVFYNTIKGEVIEDINQDGDIISCTDFKFNLADEKYLWLKELVFESDDSTNIDNNEQ